MTHVQQHCSTSTGCAAIVGSVCVPPASSKPVTWRMVRGSQKGKRERGEGVKGGRRGGGKGEGRGGRGDGRGGGRGRGGEGGRAQRNCKDYLLGIHFSPLLHIGAEAVSSMQAPWPACVYNSQPHRPSFLIIAQIIPANGEQNCHI